MNKEQIIDIIQSGNSYYYGILVDSYDRFDDFYNGGWEISISCGLIKLYMGKEITDKYYGYLENFLNYYSFMGYNTLIRLFDVMKEYFDYGGYSIGYNKLYGWYISFLYCDDAYSSRVSNMIRMLKKKFISTRGRMLWQWDTIILGHDDKDVIKFINIYSLLGKCLY